MNAMRAMIVANLKMTVRNRGALFWLLAFPILFIVLFGYLLSGDTPSVTVGVVGADTSPVATRVADEMGKVQSFKVKRGDREGELAQLRKGKRQVVVVFEPGAQGAQVAATIYFDQTQPQNSQLAVSAIQQFLSEANAQLTDAPRMIAVTVQGVETQEMKYIDFLVPGILAMSIMNNGLIGLSSAFVTYRERGILRRIRATPFPLPQFILARIVTQVLIAVAQAAILLGVAKALFDLKIVGSMLAVAVLVALGAFAFLALGFAISGFARNTEMADSLSNAIAFPMMFLGGVFFPVDSAPAWMRPITKVIPVTYFADGLRDVMVRGQSLGAVWVDLAVLLATAALGIVVAVRFFRWEARPA